MLSQPWIYTSREMFSSSDVDVRFIKYSSGLESIEKSVIPMMHVVAKNMIAWRVLSAIIEISTVPASNVRFGSDMAKAKHARQVNKRSFLEDRSAKEHAMGMKAIAK